MGEYPGNITVMHAAWCLLTDVVKTIPTFIGNKNINELN
jgi:hypothetical protein